MMVGAATPEAVLRTNIGGGGGGGGGGAPNSISHRFSSVIDRIFALPLQNTNDAVELMNLCIYLSRVIDFAIWNHEVPSRSQELPLLMKQLYQNRNDTHLLAAIMVLIISVKSACQNGWFSDEDSKVLSYMSKEIASNFCSASDFVTEPSSFFSVISIIISRFYPNLKIGHIYVSLEVKSGYDAYVSDFQISNNSKPSPEDNVRLYVVQTNSIETSSCLITPPKVEFLINGKGVEKRIDSYMDTGPQLPTIVSNMVKHGSNLLQAVGDFNGNYIIAVASTSELPSPDSTTLQDYEQCTPANVDADSDDVIEGSSRISLNCPISFKRIKIPVKGHLCKHLQCFDFDNYVDINSRRPSWRCPHCNQYVCFPDIRIDRKMVKVLQDVGPNVCDVIFCSDGSWNAVTESDDGKHNSEDITRQNVSGQPADVLDLTQNDDSMDAIPTYETEKPSLIAHEMPNTNNVDSDYWASVFMSTFGFDPSNVQPTEMTAGVPLTSPALTESFTPDRSVEAFNRSGNPSTSNEHGRYPLIPGNITRTQNAATSLPTPSALQWNSTNDLISYYQNGLSAASQTSPTASNFTATRGTPRQQNFPSLPGRPPHQNAGFVDPNQVPNMYRVSNTPTQQMPNYRLNRATSQSPGMIQSSNQPSISFSRPQRTNVASGQQSHLIAAANRMAQMSIDASRTIPPSWNPTPPPSGDQRGATSQQPPLNYDAADPSWRTSARMRGALSGQAYSDYYNQNIAQPNLQAQAARAHVLPHVQVPMGSLPVMGVPVRNSGSTVPVGQPMGSHVLHQGSSGMH